ncbi:MAG: hypothetical protein ACRC0L_07250, partial [Angustibacter sp.]
MTPQYDPERDRKRQAAETERQRRLEARLAREAQTAAKVARVVEGKRQAAQRTTDVDDQVAILQGFLVAGMPGSTRPSL